MVGILKSTFDDARLEELGMFKLGEEKTKGHMIMCVECYKGLSYRRQILHEYQNTLFTGESNFTMRPIT